jgi:2,3-bisphosphoglycerate-dependent phosphoglycerate mutase
VKGFTMSAKLILVRHGQSQFNLENRFTGWLDVPLTPQGEAEAKKAGEVLLGLKIRPTVAFTSALQRAQKTLGIILDQLKLADLPTIRNEALNERHYGALQGKNKAETAAKFGEAQVHIWRRSFDIAPPEGESLKDTADRTLPYFRTVILPLLEQGQDVLIVAHGNSLRSIVMEIEEMTPEQILKTEIGTGNAWIYESRRDGEKTRFKLLSGR